MLYIISVLFVLIGLFFISLGMLFINYNISPLRKIIEQDYIHYNPKLGFKILFPGLVLVFIASKMIYS